MKNEDLPTDMSIPYYSFGLAIAKRTLEKHGGSTNVVSEPDKGIHFS